MTTLLRNFAATIVVLVGTTLHPTLLELRFVDPNGNDVQLDKAELLLVGWGVTDRIELEPTEKGLQVNLDPEWLRPRMESHESYKRDWFESLESAYLYIQANPFASIQTLPFRWLGDSRGFSGPVKISFPGGEEAIVEKGTVGSATITLREKVQRRIRIVDPNGKPMQGVGLHANVNWSTRNHCGALVKLDSLGQFTTDDQGIVELPDGDFEYALELRGGGIPGVFQNPSHTYFPDRTITRLDLVETEMVVRLYSKRDRLELVFRRDGMPAKNANLLGYSSYCACGACWGSAGKKIGEGRFELADYYPETYEYIFLVEGEVKEPIWEKTIWKVDGTSLMESELIEVDLPSAKR